MPNRADRVPSTSQRVALPLILSAGPAAAAASTERACAVITRPSKVLECHVFPSSDIVLNGGDPSVITLQVGATVIGTASNQAAGITAAAGVALTLDAAQVSVADGAVLKLVVTNPGGGAVNLSTVDFFGTATVSPV